MAESLDVLLRQARSASRNDRITLRDPIASHGLAAINAVGSWLADPELWRFAVRVIGRAAEHGARGEAAAALRSAAVGAPVDRRAEIDAELRRLGQPGLVAAGPFGVSEREAIRDRLIAAAKRRHYLNYADLADAIGRSKAGPHWAVHIGRLLGHISTEEVAAGRPMLSAIVVSRDTRLPGEGFFGLGQQLRKVALGEDEESFARRQIEEVFDYWAR